MTSDSYGADIFTEAIGDPDTLSNLGPLRPMAGTWEGAKGSDQHPVAEGTEHDVFIEHYDLQPIDFQTNGPQLFYGLRLPHPYPEADRSSHVPRPSGVLALGTCSTAVTLTLGIPRGQVLLASGPAEADAKEFEVVASVGTEVHGILSNPFLDRAFRTSSYRMHVTVNDDGTWSYEEEGVLEIPGVAEPFSHIDRNTLTRIAPSCAESTFPAGDLRPELGHRGLTEHGREHLNREAARDMVRLGPTRIPVVSLPGRWVACCLDEDQGA